MDSSNPSYSDTRANIARIEWRRIFDRSVCDSYHPPPTRVILTADNFQTNINWGDDIQEKPENTFRMYGINVNGFTLDREGGQFAEYCQVHQELQADVSLIQEHNLDFTQPRVRSIIYDTTKRRWQRSRLAHSCTPIPFASPYKPGGTLMLSTDSVTSRIIDSGSDTMGRWVYQTFQGRHQHKVTFISAYQVVDAPHALHGTITAAAQQYRLLADQDDPTRNPRHAFRRDLRQLIQVFLDQRHDIVLAGDFNEPLGSDPEGMSQILYSCELLDLFATVHPDLSPPPTYARGQHRLDYVLVTSRLLPSIRRAGYEPFGHRFHTDHRPYFVDFDEAILFGHPTQQLASYPRRGLHANNLRQVTEYLKEKDRLFRKKNIYERILSLESQHGDRHAFAERLDRDVLAISLAAERRTTRFSQPLWSVKLSEARRKVSTLKRILTMYRTRWDMSAPIHALISQMQSSFLYPSSAGECSRRLREAQREIREIIATHYQTREAERNARIAMLESAGSKQSKTTARILRNLRKAEEIKRMFQRIRSQRQPDCSRGITRIDVPANPEDDPKTCSTWRTVDIPSEIMSLLQQRNRKHFGQAQGTPFTTEPYWSALGFCGDTPTAEQIYMGDPVVFQDDSPYVSLILRTLQTSKYRQDHPLPIPITAEAFASKLRVWRESTATSPSGLHLGHYKALVSKHSHSYDTEDLTQKHDLDQIQRDILRVHLALLNYALLRGYSYRRWHQVVNTMLLKEPGNVRIHRTRVIHIYEADYNLALGLKWRDALYTSERDGTLNEGQYGSRPNRSAHDPVFIELLQNEISRASRKSLVQTNYDATSCYDRILVSLATLASRKFGVPASIAKMNANTLQSATYKLRTELGISTEGYSHCEQFPIHGTGQGSGNSPMIWCFLSSVLFDCYQSIAHGAAYESPDHSMPITLYMIGYVDDSNGQTNQFLADPQPNPAQLLSRMQHDAQSWHNLLWTSGGDLELSKCSYQLLSWSFTTEGAPILGGGTPGSPIQLKTAGGKYASLTPLSAHSSHKTLGHYIAPSGNQQAQLRALQIKSDTAAHLIATSTLSRHETWTYYFAVYLPSVGYPLANAHFPRVALHKVQRKAMSAIFAKCGYNRNTNRAILFASSTYGGAGFRHLYAEQGVAQLQQFIRSWRRPHTQKGRLLRIAVSWIQHALGTGTPFLRHPSTSLPHLEALWFKSVRTFLADIQCQLEIAPTFVRPLARETDCYLMDSFLSSGRYSDKQIRQLNYCRLYLRVTLLSDLTNASGTYVDQSYYDGNLDSTASSISNWHPVHQARPSMRVWSLWKQALHEWCDSTLKLREPLGTWIPWQLSQSPPRQWKAYVADNTLYLRIAPDTYEVYWISPTSSFSSSHPCDTALFSEIPSHATPHDLEWLSQGSFRILPCLFPMPSLRALEPPLNFRHFLLQQDQWEQEILREWSSTMEPYELEATLSNSPFQVACDGSATPRYAGAFGWIISDQTGQRLCRGSGPVRGYRLTSYRAEAMGMLSISRFLQRLSEYTASTTFPWKIQYYCDNQALVSVVTKMLTHTRRKRPPQLTEDIPLPLDPLLPDWDVLAEIYYTVRTWRRLTVIHIKGHQDSDKPYAELSLPSQLNVDADKLAGQYILFDPDPKPWALLLPHTGVHLHGAKGTITYRHTQMIRTLESTPAIVSQLKARNGWTEDDVQAINWEAHGKACRRVTANRRVHTVKFIHDALPTNKVLHRYDSRQSLLCPRCKQETETRDHVLLCLHAAAWRADFLEHLNRRCIALNTRSALRELLLLGITHWFSQLPTLPDVSNYDNDLIDLMQQQTAIGWRHILSGRFVCQWATLQGIHLGDELGHLTSPKGTQWTTDIITTIWTAWYEVWDARNAVVHGADSQSRRLLLREQLNIRLRRLFAQRNHVEPSLARVFSTPEETLAQKGVTYVQNWLSIAEPLVENSVKVATQRAIQGMRDIRSYWTRGGNTDTD